MLLLFCAFGERTMSYALEGYRLFLANVFPALFPFAVLVGFLARLGAFEPKKGGGPIRLVLKLFFICALTGAPSGSLLTQAAFGANGSAEQGRALAFRSRLSASLNLCCPAFVFGTVSVSMLRLGSFCRMAPLVIAHYLSALLLALIITFSHRKSGYFDNNNLRNAGSGNAPSIATVFPAAVYDAMQTMLKLLGTLVFFMIPVRLIDSFALLRFLNPAVRSVLIGMAEMTSGVASLAVLALPLRLKLALTAFLLSFGGVSVAMQAAAAAKTRLSDYLLVKLAGAFIAALIAYLTFPLFPSASPVFGDTGFALAAQRTVSMAQVALLCLLCSSAAVLLAVFTARRTRT